MDDNNDFNEEIEDIDDELGEEEDVAEEGYGNDFSYGPKVDQGVVERIQNIRNTMQNFGGPSRKDKEEDGKDNKKGLDKKDSLDNKDESDKKDGDKKKSDSDSHTPKINDNSEDELASKVASSTSKEVAKEAGEAAADKAKEEAAKKVAEKAVEKKTLKSIKWIIIKYVASGLGIIFAILFVFMLLAYLYENLVGSISSFFGVSEKTSDENAKEENYTRDGLFTDYKYQYYNKSTCDLNNYKESKCLCSPDESNCVALSHEELIKVLKSDDKCKIDNKFLLFWDKLILGLTGGEFDDECRLLRYVRGSITNYEEKYKSFNLKLDNGLVVATILQSYDSQYGELGKNASKQTDYVESSEHYRLLKDIAKSGLVKTKDIDDIVRNSVLEDVYPYYTYENETCTLRAHVGYKFSLNKWSIFMRYGDGDNNSYLGVSDSDFSVAGYLSIGRRKILDREISSETSVSTSQLINMSGSGWVYYRMLNNAWANSAEECRKEEFFSSRGMTGEKDINVFLQKVEDVYSMDDDNIQPATVEYMINGNKKTTTVNFDYRAGYVYNKFTSMKRAIDSGKAQYDSKIVPKRAEQHIGEIIERKSQINQILFFEDNQSDILTDITTDPTYAESNKLYWPIGSNSTTEINGVLFAADAPANTKINSYYGKRKHPITGEYKMHNGVDLAGREGVTNVIAAKGGTVDKVNNGCTPGNHSCGGGYGNYIKIKHSDGKYTLYAHLHKNSITVSTGDEVSQGQVIAKVGNTGSSTGAHLHFEVRTSSTARVNPLDYISANDPRPSASGEISSVQGKDNKNTVCLSLLKSGMSEAATIALMINIQAESSFNPECNTQESDGEYSYGLFQWKGPEQKQELMSFASEKGLAYNEVPAQLSFVFYKMQHGGNRAKQAYDSIMSTTNTAQEKATDFCLLYERPANKETHCPNRVTRHYDKISTYVKNGCSD